MTDTWSSVETFSIESATGNNNVYANGRQSILIRVAIKVVNKYNQPVALSKDELSSITLVDERGREIKSLEGWSCSSRNIGNYSYYPSQGSGGRSFSDMSSASVIVDTVDIDFYVRTTSELPLKLGARITRAGATPEIFYSRDLNKGSYEIVPVKPPSYGASSYRLRETVIQPFRQVQGGTTFLTYYSLESAIGQNFVFRDVQLSPEGLLGAYPFVLDYADLVGYVKPGKKSINYPISIKYAPLDIGAFPSDGKILFVKTAVTSAKNKYFGVLKMKQPVTICSINATDEYGNPHKLSLQTPYGAGGFELELV